MPDLLLPFLPGLILMMLRVGSMFYSLSFMSKDAASRWPHMVLTVSLGAILFLVDPQVVPLPGSFIFFAVMALREILLGIFLGLGMSVVFFAIRISGELIGRDMALSLARVMDPAVGSGGVVLSTFFEMLAVMLFFYIDGHHLVLGLLSHFNVILPLGGGFNPAAAYQNLAWLGSYMMENCIIVAAPVFSIMLLLTIVMMIVGRAVPKLPIMQFGLGIRIGVGMYATILFVGRSMPKFRQMFEEVSMRLWSIAGDMVPL